MSSSKCYDTIYSKEIIHEFQATAKKLEFGKCVIQYMNEQHSNSYFNLLLFPRNINIQYFSLVSFTCFVTLP